MRNLWLLEFGGNALLIFLVWEWLGMRDSRVSQLGLSFALALLICAGAVWLHSRTFNVKPLRFALLALLFLLICWGLALLPLTRFSLWLASTLTLLTRKPVAPHLVFTILDWVRWVAQWIAAPLLLLRKTRPVFWSRCAGVVLVAFLLPWQLILWTPELSSPAAQIASFVARFGLAYCLAVTGCVVFARLTSRATQAGVSAVSH